MTGPAPRRRPRRFAPAAVLAVALALAGSAVAGPGDPIPGIDVVVKKQPAGAALVAATTDKAGRFTVRVAEPGSYTLTAACRAAPRCPETVIVLNGLSSRMSANEAVASGALKTVSFSVTPGRAEVISGVVQAAGPRQAIRPVPAITR
jgi:hypothetical protein